MTASQATLDRDDIESFIGWVSQHKGVEAFPVYDYIRLAVPDPNGADTMIGPLNGVTIQWDIHDELVQETPEGQENIVHPVAGGAIHVRPGGTAKVTVNGFDVDNPPIEIDENSDKPKVDPALVAAVIEAVGK